MTGVYLVSEQKIKSSYQLKINIFFRISGIGAMKPNTIILGFSEEEDLRKDDFADPTSDFLNDKLDAIFPKLSGSGNAVPDVDDRKRNLKRLEFVRSIDDVLKLRKNVCVCRNFQELDRLTF